MADKLILYPIFPMLALTVYVLFRTFLMRVAAVKSGEVSHKYYRLYSMGDEPEACRANSRHLTNLLEIPPLFYISCILIYVTDTNSLVLMICAWLFALSRFIHSYVHLGTNRLRNRYRIYFVSICLLIAIWVVSLVGIVRL
jgi:hypothetical protein